MKIASKLGTKLLDAVLLTLALASVACAHAAYAADHPLEPLRAGELQSAFELVIARFHDDASLPKEPLRFPIAVLAEPPKAEVLAWSRGQPFARRAEVHVLHYPSNRGWVAEVDLIEKKVSVLTELPAGTQTAVSGEEYGAASDLVRAYEPWRRALRERGVQPDLAYVDVWAPGDEPLAPEISAQLPYGTNARLLRCLTFDRGAPPEQSDPQKPQNPYVRPVEGVVVTVDMNARKVVAMTDTVVRPVLASDGNAPASEVARPLTTAVPEGSNVSVQGGLVRWGKWQFYAALHPREGLVLYDVRFDDAGVLRKIAYRLSLSEIYVPYGLGDPGWSWRSAFDVGEYNAGTLAQPLEIDRDVPAHATFLDAVMFSDVGPGADNPSGSLPLSKVVALYERDAGMLWTRTDPTTLERDTRAARELVVTWNCWIGNYVYGFDWIFKRDGTIEVKVVLTGTTLNRGVTSAPEASAPKVGKDARGVLVAAPNHQHFFSFRLDLDVDGPRNSVMEMEVAHLPNTGFRNSFDAVTAHLPSEGHRDANPFAMRHWHVESGTLNAYGKPTGYALDPGQLAVPYSAPDFPALARARFAEHAVWMTRHRDGELYAAGRFPNQAKTADGLPVFTGDAESLEGQDVVLWYTTGLTHIARPEDFPVMPSETVGFRLSPRGFFARNPALDATDHARKKEVGRE